MAPTKNALDTVKEKMGGLKKKMSSLSRNEMIGIGVASAIVVGGVVYVTTSRGRKRKSS